MEGYEKLQFYYLWIFANVIAFVLAFLVAYEVSDLAVHQIYSLRAPDNEAIIHGTFYSFIVNPLPYALVNGILFGLVLGVTEWLFLRQPIGLSKRWIIISIIVWELSSLFFVLLKALVIDDVMIRGILTGSLLGVIQWFYLRDFSPRARWWIVARMISGFFAFSTIVYRAAPIGMGFFNGLITGIAAALLLPNLPATVTPIALEEQLQ